MFYDEPFGDSHFASRHRTILVELLALLLRYMAPVARFASLCCAAALITGVAEEHGEHDPLPGPHWEPATGQLRVVFMGGRRP